MTVVYLWIKDTDTVFSRIWIRVTQKDRNRLDPDPDPHHWLQGRLFTRLHNWRQIIALRLRRTSDHRPTNAYNLTGLVSVMYGGLIAKYCLQQTRVHGKKEALAALSLRISTLYFLFKNIKVAWGRGIIKLTQFIWANGYLDYIEGLG